METMTAMEQHVNDIQKSSHTIYQNVLRVLRQSSDMDVDPEERYEFKCALINEAAELFTAVGRLELMYAAGILGVHDIMEMRSAVMDTFSKCDGMIKGFVEANS